MLVMMKDMMLLGLEWLEDIEAGDVIHPDYELLAITPWAWTASGNSERQVVLKNRKTGETWATTVTRRPTFSYVVEHNLVSVEDDEFVRFDRVEKKDKTISVWEFVVEQ